MTGADWAEDRERYGMMQPEVTKCKAPKALDTITDAVLRYRPPEKAKGRREAREAEGETCRKERLTILTYIIPTSLQGANGCVRAIAPAAR